MATLGPYLSERQWGTVREDYSENGDAWSSFTHDQARSRAYRWGEDGLAGISDDHQRLCFALALWNGHDPILKERLFGLTNTEGNHGEDVKEYYFYLDSHADALLHEVPVQVSRRRPFRTTTWSRRTDSARGSELEYELLDTGIFDDDRYFDVFVEYAKAAPDDILIAITAHNRGPAPAELHLLPTLWFRNTWWLGDPPAVPCTDQRPAEAAGTASVVAAQHEAIGRALPLLPGRRAAALHRERDEPRAPLRAAQPDAVRQGRHQRVRRRRRIDAVNPERDRARRSSAHYRLTDRAAGGSTTIRLRLNDQALARSTAAPVRRRLRRRAAARRARGRRVLRRDDARRASEDEARVMRQALAGMLWSKQYYDFDVDLWLEERDAHPLRPRQHGRSATALVPHDHRRRHLDAGQVGVSRGSRPGTSPSTRCRCRWSTPISPKSSSSLMLTDLYLHPSGQLPAYEWNFSDVNPPVHAWATASSTSWSRRSTGQGDIEFLQSILPASC